MPKIKKTIAIIGAGASGLAAAISAAKNNSAHNYKIQIFEKASAPGKPILKTGNGRCNFSNHYAELPNAINYHNHKFVEKVQNTASFMCESKKSLENNAVLEFFQECGLV